MWLYVYCKIMVVYVKVALQALVGKDFSVARYQGGMPRRT